MCGIAGIVHFGRLKDAPSRVRSMADGIRHRGPDDDGYWHDGDCALGFRRLAIVDLDGGRQPMSNETGSVQLVFNGEIYNHRELRRDLEAKGHRFSTDHSDTEVLAHGWEEWGTELPSRLNGMFAFAIWDRKDRSLFMARDRLGIKPIYYTQTAEGVFAFGSEARAVAECRLQPLEVNTAGIVEYFSLMNNWDGRTLFKGIEMLPGGCWELIKPSGRQRRTFWDFEFNRSDTTPLAEKTERFSDILTRSIERQIDADVPVASYLSGGIDSSAIAAIAHTMDPTMRAYSCIFDLDGVGDDAFVDEREFSRAVASELDMDRVEYEVPQDALTRQLDPTVASLEYPRMGMAYVNYLIAQRVAQDGKVVFSGMGGDEMTGGYVGRYKIVDRDNPSDPFSIYRSALNVPIAEAEISQAFTPDILREAGGFDPMQVVRQKIDQAPSRDPWDVLMYVDAKSYLHGLLVLEDKLSMIHSLETRVPLLDNELIDYLVTVPWDDLIEGDTGKVLFREAVRGHVPDVIYRKPKMGFGPPDASWYRGRLQNWVRGKLDSLAKREIIQPAFIDAKFDAHTGGEANNVALIWCLLSMESWCDQSGFYNYNSETHNSAVMS